MKTLLGLLAVVAVAVVAVLAYQWWAGNKSPVTISYPTDGTVLAGNTVPVRLNATQDVQTKLSAPGSTTEIVTYLDNKEVGRTKDLSYSLTSIAPGQHQLSVAMVEDTNGQNSASLNLMPQPVSFTLGGGSGASDSNVLPPGVNANPYNSDASVVQPQATATPATDQIPAATVAPIVPAAPVQAPAALPDTGMGGLQRQVKAPDVNNVASQPAIVSNAQAAQPVAVMVDQSSSQLAVANTQVNTDALVSANQVQNAGGEDAMSVIFRLVAAFYIAGFIVALGFVMITQKRRV